jgi:2-methylaconitate cis-trans-isomerase PrpF
MYLLALPTERRRWPVAVVAAIVVTAALALATAGSAQAATINVNPATGNNYNSGSLAHPLKTLGVALGRAHSGDAVQLARPA